MRILLALAVGSCSAVAWAAAPAAVRTTAPETSPVDDCRKPSPGTPWWVGFDDATLNLLQLMAGLRSDPQSARPGSTGPNFCRAIQISASYIQLQVLSARLAILRALQGTIERQVGLIQSQDGRHREELAQVLRARQQNVAVRIDTAQGLARVHVDSLRAFSGVGERELLSALAPALKEYAVPRYRAEIPASLPQAQPPAATRHPLRSPPGPSFRQARLLPVGAVDPDLPDLPAAPAATVEPAARAAAEQRLADLRQSTAAVAMLGQLVTTRRLELEATRQRQQLGHATELESIERYYMVLIDTERFTAAAGDVAMAWIGLHQALAGRLDLIAEPGEIVRRELLPN